MVHTAHGVQRHAVTCSWPVAAADENLGIFYLIFHRFKLSYKKDTVYSSSLADLRVVLPNCGTDGLAFFIGDNTERPLPLLVMSWLRFPLTPSRGSLLSHYGLKSLTLSSMVNKMTRKSTVICYGPSPRMKLPSLKVSLTGITLVSRVSNLHGLFSRCPPLPVLH